MFTYETMILLLLQSRGPNYETQIAVDLRALTDQEISAGGIHQTVGNLQKQGYVTKSRQMVPVGRPRCYYTLTASGALRADKIREIFRLFTEVTKE